MKRKLLTIMTMAIVISLAITMIFAGCKPETTEDIVKEEAAPTEEGVEEEKVAEEEVVVEVAESTEIDRSGDHYAFVGTFMSLDYYVDYYRAANRIMEEWPGVTIEILGPADYDIETTLSIIEQQIAKGVTGILSQPWGEDWLPTLDKAVDSGIPVAFLGVDFPQAKRLVYCGTGNTKMGMVAGEWLAEKINYEGQVAVMRNPVLANVTERWEGFMMIMDKYPNIEVVADLDHQNDSNIGAQLIAGTLQKYPDLAAVWGGDGISGPAVALGIREAGLEKGSVIIVGADREDALLASIADGEITATVVQGAALEFYYGVKILDMYVHNSGPEVSYDDAAAGISLVPDVVNPGVNIVTIDNVEYFRRGYVEDPTAR